MRLVFLFLIIVLGLNLSAQEQDTLRAASLFNQNAFVKNIGVLEIGNTSNSAALEINSKNKGFLLPKLDSAAMAELIHVNGIMFYSTYFNSIAYWADSSLYTFNYKVKTFNATVGDTIEIPFCASAIIDVSFLVNETYIKKEVYECIDYSYVPDTIPINEDSLKINYTETFIYLASDTSFIAPDQSDNYIFNGTWNEFGYHFDNTNTRYWIKPKFVCHQYKQNYTLIRGKVVGPEHIDVIPHIDEGKTYITTYFNTNLKITYQ